MKSNRFLYIFRHLYSYNKILNLIYMLMKVVVRVVVVVVVVVVAAAVVVVVVVETLQSILLYTQLERQQPTATLNQRGNGIQCTAIC